MAIGPVQLIVQGFSHPDEAKELHAMETAAAAKSRPFHPIGAMRAAAIGSRVGRAAGNGPAAV